MATETWTAGASSDGSWTTAANWTPATVPTEGDTVVINGGGGPMLQGATYGNLSISMGATSNGLLDLMDDTLGAGVSITTAGPVASSTIWLTGTTSFDGTMLAEGAGVALPDYSVSGQAWGAGVQITPGTGGGTLALGPDALLSATLGSEISLDEGAPGTGVTLSNGGTIAADGGYVWLDGSTTLLGTGTVRIDGGGVAWFNGAVPSGQTVAFAGAGELVLGEASGFAGTVTGFAAGDEVALPGTVADALAYANGTLTLLQDGVTTGTVAMMVADPAALRLVSSAQGPMVVASNATRTWIGGSRDWFNASTWSDGNNQPGTPLAGDTLLLGAGTVSVTAADVASHGRLDGETVVFGGTDAAPAVLSADDAMFGQNVRLAVTGSDATGTLLAAGQTWYNGQIAVTGPDTALTLAVAADASGAGTLTLTSQSDVVVGPEGGLLVTGGELDNDGVIVVEGSMTMAAGTTLGGISSGSEPENAEIRLEDGGTLSVAGAVSGSATVQFGDASGLLALSDPSSFQGSITWMGAGDRIDFVNTAVQVLSANPTRLTLMLNNSVTETLSIGTVDDGVGTFSVASDGHGGSLLTYAPLVTQTIAPLPVAAVASAGGTVSLANLLQSSFGSIPAGYTEYSLSSFDAAALRHADFNYWVNASGPVPTQVASWTIAGRAVLADGWVNYYPMLSKANTVTSAQASTAQLVAGNQIMPANQMTVPVARDAAGKVTETVIYSVQVLDPAVMSPTAGSGRVDPADIVASVQRFAATYVGVQNDNDCGFIAEDVAAATGAVMPGLDFSTDPTANSSGGFWRIAYRGTDSGAVADWASQAQPGDVVRMGWENGGQHTTTVLSRLNDSSDTLVVYDNDARYAGSNGSTIAIHQAVYWPNTIPESVTIFRLDPLHQYLVQGVKPGEVLQGTTFNDLLRPVGADTISAGPGSDEVQATLAQLNGSTMTQLGLGDTLDLTDLAPAAAGVSFDAASGTLSLLEGGATVAALRVEGAVPGDAFFVTPDGTGGSIVTLAPVSLTGTGAAARAALLAAFAPLATAGRTTNLASTTASGAAPSVASGETNVLLVGDAALSGGGVTVPAGYDAAFLQTTGPASLGDTVGGKLLVGGTANATLTGLGAADTLVGGAGSDALFAGGAGALAVGGTGSDTLVGGAGAQTLMGGAGGALIFGGTGAQVLLGGQGGSTIVGGSGAAMIAGGGHALVFAGAASAITAGAGDTVVGGAASATVWGSAGALAFEGAGTLNVVAGPGATTVMGGSGGGVIYGSDGADMVLAGAGTQLVLAGSGNETLDGSLSTGPVVAFAGAGVDRIALGAGGGWAFAGGGNATVTAGAGAAVFAVVDGQAGGRLVINGFDPGQDRLLLSGYGPGAQAAALSGAVRTAGGVSFGLSDGTEVTLAGVTTLTGAAFA